MKTSSNPKVGITNRLLGLVAITILALAALFGPSKARAATYFDPYITICQGTKTNSPLPGMVSSFDLNRPGDYFNMSAGFCKTNHVMEIIRYHVYGYRIDGSKVLLEWNEWRNATCGVASVTYRKRSLIYDSYELDVQIINDGVVMYTANVKCFGAYNEPPPPAD